MASAMAAKFGLTSSVPVSRKPVDFCHHQVVERAFRKQRIARRIALHVPNYLGVGLIVANTDLLVIVPERVAEILSRENRVKVVPCPIALPSYQVKQHWHERYVGDPANMWLRSVISRLFSG
jgi:DNA-binding transcriptional LysR family regulator